VLWIVTRTEAATATPGRGDILCTNHDLCTPVLTAGFRRNAHVHYSRAQRSDPESAVRLLQKGTSSSHGLGLAARGLPRALPAVRG
jgi:hypothetical protein